MDTYYLFTVYLTCLDHAIDQIDYFFDEIFNSKLVRGTVKYSV